MPRLPRYAAAAAFGIAAIGAGALLGQSVWPAPETLEFCALILAGLLVSVFAMRDSTEDWATMSPSFVVDVVSLLLLGPRAMMFVATAGTVARSLSQRSQPAHQILSNAAVAMVATQTAGLVHFALRGTVGSFEWPWQAIPIAAAVVAYCAMRSASAETVVPFFMRQPVRPWLPSFLKGCPNYVIAATVGVVIAELIVHGMWSLLALVAVPVYFAYRAHSGHVARITNEGRWEEIETLDQAMAVVDSEGAVTQWNAALEQLVECRRDRAIGGSVAEALPAIRSTDLLRAIDEALTLRCDRTIPHVGVPSSEGGRILQVTVLPVAGGATLLWQDVTARVRNEQTLKRREERLTLAAEGANDGLWEWDLRTQEFFASGRWWDLLGLDEPEAAGRPEDWINRVHDDDVVPLREALEAHVSGRTDHFQLDHRIRHADGTYRRFLCRGIVVRGTDRRPARIAGSLTDTTERAKEQEQLRSAGFRDPLTGLSNRAVFVEGLGRRLEQFKRRRGDRFAVLYLDLDRFKVVNDSLGHLIGDELLIAVSRRLESCLRPSDSLARLGGDEFAILLNGLNDEQQANVIAFRIQEALSAPFSIGGREVFTSASIGIAPGLAEYATPDEIMRDADTAMYHAKSRGKARHELFDADMHARTRDRLGLENDLRHAVSNDDFEVHYQPIVSLATSMCVGFESLVRWTRNGEAISPATFIPIAEELGLIESLGTWVLEQACRTFAGWQRRYPDSSLEWITVNVSSRQLMQQNFLRIVEQAIQRSGLKPSDLRVEITETALMDSPNVAAEVLRELRDFGVKIYLDDFGTGYSSLSHLHKLPVDALKIDRSFVKSLLIPDRPATVESILALARTLNTSVVAEGIETEVQARELERLGCTHAQGYFFSRPLAETAA